MSNLPILINFNKNSGQVVKFIIKQILYNYVKDDKENKKEIVIYELLQSKLLYGRLSIYLIATYGEEIIDIANKVFKKLKER